MVEGMTNFFPSYENNRADIGRSFSQVSPFCAGEQFGSTTFAAVTINSGILSLLISQSE